MSQHAARCPYCVNVVQLRPSFWERIGMASASRRCPACRNVFSVRDAQTMGAAYGHWVARFGADLAALVEGLPILPEHVMYRALGSPPKDSTRLVPSFEELLRLCTHHYRAVLVEMSRGREATLDVVHLRDETGQPETVAVLGKSSAESGEREWQQLIGRSGAAHWVLCTYPAAQGAEPRVRRAVHERVHVHAHPPRGAAPSPAAGHRK